MHVAQQAQRLSSDLVPQETCYVERQIAFPSADRTARREDRVGAGIRGSEMLREPWQQFFRDSLCHHWRAEPLCRDDAATREVA
jgi:hypothetical protein